MGVYVNRTLSQKSIIISVFFWKTGFEIYILHALRLRRFTGFLPLWSIWVSVILPKDLETLFKLVVCMTYILTRPRLRIIGYATSRRRRYGLLAKMLPREMRWEENKEDNSPMQPLFLFLSYITKYKRSFLSSTFNPLS